MKSRPRFLIINENYLGHATVHQLLCQVLRKDTEVQFDCITLETPPNFYERVMRKLASLRFPHAWVRQQNLDFERLRFQWYVASIARHQVLAALRKTHYDALFFHSQTAALRCCDIMQQIPSLVSTDITNHQAAVEWNLPETRWTYWPNMILEKRVFESAAAISTLSQWARESILTQYPTLPQGKVHHFRPGVNLEPFLSLSGKPKQNPKPRLLFVGGDFHRKGGVELLACYQQFFRDCATLSIVTQAGVTVPDGVECHTNLKPYSAGLLEEYRRADIFVLPTRNEAYGHVFIEAMAAGLPVITTNINAIPEIVRNGQEGFLIPPQNEKALQQAIATMLSHPEKRVTMGKNGQARATSCFDAQLCFTAYVHCLKTLARSS